MSLSESQEFLARLLTDLTLRTRFADDPDSVAAEFGLSPEETRGLEALLPGPISGFATSLIRKRRGEVGSLLPLTVRALGADRFARLFHRHASAYVPSGIKKHRDDAIKFAEVIAREIAEPPWLADLARLEATMMLAYDPTRRWTFLKLRHHPSDLARAGDGEPARKRPTMVIWYRLKPSGRLRRLVIG